MGDGIGGAMEKIGFGVIGCGFIGMTHAEIIASMDDACLAAVTDYDKEKRERAVARWSCAAYKDYREMLADSKVQAVSVCLPSGMHSQATIEAARAGKHVICEKPIDISVERAEEMVEVCEECGVIFSVIMQHRFDQAVTVLKNALESGELGRLIWGSSRTIWYRDDIYFSNPWRGTWKFDGGGALINQSIHYIDLLLYIFGKVKSVSGKCKTLLHSQIETEDVGIANIEFENGCLGTIEGTTASYPGLYAELAVFAEHGTVIIRNDELLFYHMKTGKNQKFEMIANAEKANILHQDASICSDSHKRQYQDFIQAIRKKRKPLVSGKDALESLKVIMAIYRSAAKNEEVFLD